MAFRPSQYRNWLFAIFLLAPPLVVYVFIKTAHISFVLPAAWWLLCLAYFTICLVLYFITTPPSPLSDLPQPPKSTSILGHIYGILFGRPKGGLFLNWTNNVSNSGLIYFNMLRFGIGQALLLTSPEALHEALITRSYEFEKTTADRKLLQSFIGRGLIVVEGSEHKAQRKIVTPAFSGKQISDLILPVFWAKSKELTDVIANQLHTSPTASDSTGRIGVVDLNQWASRVTLDIIGLACVGKDFNSLHNDEDELCKMYETILRPHETQGLTILFEAINIILPSRIARMTPFFKHVRDAAYAKERLRFLCRELLVEKRRDMENESSRHIDILSVLIRSRQLTDEGLVDQLLTFLAAGHETTAGALTWTMYLLAINPVIQEQVRQELRSHFVQSNHEEKVSSLDSVPLLNAIINEQLRLLPAVPSTGRIAVQDTTLLGHPVPKGTLIVTAPWAINRSKKHWGPDAEEFRPERWFQENMSGDKKSPMSVITFLHGPRSCIGQAFSRAELRCLIAAMVLRFQMQMADTDEIVEPVGLVTIKPKNGMRLLLKELPL